LTRPALTLSVSSSKSGTSVQLRDAAGTVLADGSNKTSKKGCPEPYRALIVNIGSRSHPDREPPFPRGINIDTRHRKAPLAWMLRSIASGMVGGVCGETKVQDKDDTTSY